MTRCLDKSKTFGGLEYTVTLHCLPKRETSPKMPVSQKNYDYEKKQFGRLPTSDETNDEIAIDVAGPFEIANRAPTTNKVIDFLTHYIANNAIFRQIRTAQVQRLLAINSKTFVQKI